MPPRDSPSSANINTTEDIVPVTKILVSAMGSANTLCKVPSPCSNFNCCGILNHVGVAI